MSDKRYNDEDKEWDISAYNKPEKDPYVFNRDEDDDEEAYGGDVLGGSDVVGSGHGCCDGGYEGGYYGGYEGGMESQLNLKTEAILFIDAVLVVFVVVLIVCVVGAYYVDDKVSAAEYDDPNYESTMSKVTSVPLHVVGGLVVARLVVGAVM